MKIESVTATTQWSEFLHHTVIVMPIRFPDRTSCRVIPLTPENIKEMREKVRFIMSIGGYTPRSVLAALGITSD